MQQIVLGGLVGFAMVLKDLDLQFTMFEVV